MGETLESGKMRGIIPPDHRLICKELIGIKNLLFGLNESDLQPVVWPKELAADSIYRTVRCLVGDQDTPRGYERRSSQERCDLLNVQPRVHR